MLRSKCILKYLLVCVLMLCSYSTALAQDNNVSFTVNAPRQVISGNKFAISYVLNNGEGENLKFEDIEGAVKLYGPSVSTSQSYQFINGVSSSNKKVEYTITYRAENVGKLTVPAASVQVDGKSYTTNSTTIEVLEKDKSVANNNNNNNNNYQRTPPRGVQVDNIQTQTSDKAIGKDDLFVRIILSKGSVYEQEPVVCTIKLYTKYQISSFMSTLQPSYEGFLIDEIPITAKMNEMEHYNGQNYMVAELKKSILFPQKSGELTVTSGNYDITVTQFDQYPSIFGYVNVPVEKKVQVKSNQVKVKVKSLPEDKPDGFNGAVGDFKVTAELKNSAFRTGEAAVLSYDISGTGNIKYLKAPKVEFPSQFDVYEPQTNIDAKVIGSNVRGSETVDYTFVPLYAGDYEIKTSDFVYFNPSKKEYITIEIPNYTINVKQGTTSYGSAGDAPNSVKSQNVDIRHIKSGDLSLSKIHSVYVDSAIYWLWYIIPILLLISVLVIYRRTIKERANTQLMKNKKAGKVAKRKLKKAKVFMLANDSNKFYEELLNAIYGYISDKLGIPVSMLNKENVAAELANYGADTELIDTVLTQLDRCEFAQYAPQGGDNTLDMVYNEVSDVMDRIEGIKRK